MKRKFRIILDVDKYRVQVKDFNHLFSWANVDYFYSEAQAKSYIAERIAPKILYESDWISTRLKK